MYVMYDCNLCLGDLLLIIAFLVLRPLSEESYIYAARRINHTATAAGVHTYICINYTRKGLCTAAEGLLCGGRAEHTTCATRSAFLIIVIHYIFRGKSASYTYISYTCIHISFQSFYCAATGREERGRANVESTSLLSARAAGGSRRGGGHGGCRVEGAG